MGKITIEMLEISYPVLQRVYTGQIGLVDAGNLIAENSGMNRNTAQRLAHSFKKLMAGEQYASVMSGDMYRYYLECIVKDYGIGQLRKALSAVEQHIEYYFKASGNPQKGVVAIIMQFRRRYGLSQ
ncbi:hypothetical protein LJC04_02485 [Ruminococcaceae bacterium OttesenSCG-928-O06]|nr:hypothetical protein [Ruminococcaceae bacterium OttesenSCG-928-O06]